ncbi:thiopurine S-methyltransferase [Aestuariibacter sp. AA17]|uniref:Thiopurine S-methyltransferase n=1 Tax=Fluctibacter corallii TaxID=2984329 RepID=A0ABT3AD83_9ALTE|nr:thiopurine S-methyltransferase [Aestuariibacter sp. AA17]MCV2886619.1 thiopurine S-methyltransferase [Aestuariibacter sp. AA17]
MEKAFWMERWETNRIAFHEGEVNAYLAAHFSGLQLAEGSTVFVPLCGKTVDMAWLRSRGIKVVGAELSERAVQDFFHELGISPSVSNSSTHRVYQADGITLYVGDIFELDAEQIGHVDAVYDRAALVALPFEMRERYAKHLLAITNHAKQFVVLYQYDENLMQGPPFSVPNEELKDWYGPHYQFELKVSAPLPEGIRGTPVFSSVWQLNPAV